jgi:hypothetical protein
MRFLGIVGLGLAAGVAFGLLQTAATALVCEFDPAGLVVHPVIGVTLGLGLAIAARVGSRPKRAWRSLVRPLLMLLGLMTAFATAAGVIGFTLARSGNLMLPAEVKEQLPAAKWEAFQACALAHQASYNVAFAGGGMLVAWVWVTRKRLHPRHVATA